MVDSESSVVQVSPTVLSSDLFSPGVAKKVTFPFVGVFRRPNRVTVWGTESAKYGGVGKLPSLTQVPGDFVKSRSHRHYASGINNYNACSQPYAVTSLSLSGCRINDQLLPAPFYKHQQLDEPWPGHAYTSHICRFDVFPRFDPERTKFDVPFRRKLKQKLKPATQEALEQLSKSIYRTSVYQDATKDSKHDETQTEPSLVNRLAWLKREEARAQNVEENWEVSDQEEIEINESNEDDDDEEIEESGLSTKEHKLEGEEPSDNSDLPAVWPVWPVGLNNMRKAPLNFPKIPLPTYTPQDFSRRNRLQAVNTDVKQGSEEETLQSNTATKLNDKNGVRITCKHIPALTAYTSSTLGLGDSKHFKFTNRPENTNLKELCRLGVGLVPVKHLAGVDFIKLPLIGQEKADVQSHEQPEVKKHCTTGMLGARFKTDAHKRYHEMYSDVIPDLRDSTITGRQHFFWGIHACALR